MEYWSKMKRRGQKHVLSTASCVVQLNIYKYVWLKKKKNVVRLTRVSIILSDRRARVCLEGMHIDYCWEVYMYNTYILCR